MSSEFIACEGIEQPLDSRGAARPAATRGWGRLGYSSRQCSRWHSPPRRPSPVLSAFSAADAELPSSPPSQSSPCACICPCLCAPHSCCAPPSVFQIHCIGVMACAVLGRHSAPLVMNLPLWFGSGLPGQARLSNMVHSPVSVVPAHLIGVAIDKVSAWN